MACLRGLIWIGSLACLLGAMPVDAVAKTVGQIAKATPGATVKSGSRRLKAVARMAISQGDTISTNKTGSVQIIFVDDTRVAVGPNSTFSVDNVALRTRNRANRFAVTAVKGSFRFISGRSRKEVYEVTTPIATMGIRGTIFDLQVYGTRQLDIALLEGAIRACRNRGGRCARISGNCAIASTTQFGGFRTPNTRDEFDRYVSTSFPYIRNQTPLIPQLRTDVGSCDRVRASLRSEARDPVQRNRIDNLQAPQEPQTERPTERQTNDAPRETERRERSDQPQRTVFSRPQEQPDNRRPPDNPPQPPGRPDPEPPQPPDPEPPAPPDPEPPQPPDPEPPQPPDPEPPEPPDPEPPEPPDPEPPEPPDSEPPDSGGDNPGSNRSGGGDGSNPGGGGNPNGNNNPGNSGGNGNNGNNGNNGKGGDAPGQSGDRGNSGNAPGKNK